MHKRFFQSKLQGEDEQMVYPCVIYKGREGPFISTHFNGNLLIISDKLLLLCYGREDLTKDTCFTLSI